MAKPQRKRSGGRSSVACHNEMVNQILVACSATNLGRFWRQETGAAFRKGQAMIYYGILGGGDISGILRGGRRVEIEVKTGKGVLRESQINFRAMIEAFDGLYVLARSVDDAVSAIRMSTYAEL